MKENGSPRLPQGFARPSDMVEMAEGEAVLLALSGGADSSALLDMLCQSGCAVECAHLNHMIRGAAADRDEDFCRSAAESRGLPFYSERVDIPRIARECGEGLEAAARRERYAFLERVMSRRGIRILITAHNADDNLETMLLRLARGCGARGMCGIPPVRELSGGRLVLRPMLGVTKAEVLHYCRERKIEYVTDETNSDTDYSRNRVRANILPELWAINPAASAAAARLGAELREDCEYLDRQARQFIADNAVSPARQTPRSAPSRGVPTAALSTLPRPISARVLRMLYDVVATDSMLEARHISRLLELVSELSSGGDTTECRRLMSLPGGCMAVTVGGLFMITAARDEAGGGEILPDGIYPLTDGKNPLPGGFSVFIAGNTVAESENGKNINIIYKVATKTHLSADKIKGTLFARPRRSGDRILMGGMHKSLKKLLCDCGVPREDRARLPIICDEGGVAFVPFVGVRDDLRADRGEVVRRLEISVIAPQDGGNGNG